jgi:hypothetical protein
VARGAIRRFDAEAQTDTANASIDKPIAISRISRKSIFSGPDGNELPIL